MSFERGTPSARRLGTASANDKILTLDTELFRGPALDFALSSGSISKFRCFAGLDCTFCTMSRKNGSEPASAAFSSVRAETPARTPHPSHPPGRSNPGRTRLPRAFERRYAFYSLYQDASKYAGRIPRVALGSNVTPKRPCDRIYEPTRHLWDTCICCICMGDSCCWPCPGPPIPPLPPSGPPWGPPWGPIPLGPPFEG